MSNPFANWTQADIDRHNAKVTGKPVEQPKPTNKAVERERDLHDDIEAHCREQGYLYRHDRMDMPTTGQVGWPDWSIFLPNTKVIFLECKSRKGKATTAQLACLAHAKKFGFRAEIVDNFADAKKIMDEVAAQS